MADSQIKIHFPLAPDVVMDFSLTKKITREQFKRILQVIELAEESCIVADTVQAEQAESGKE